jgi:hypothetical protein
MYNALTFDLGTLLSTFYGVAAATVPVFLIIYAIGNCLGPITLGRLFDTVGRKPMISLCYLGSAALTVVLGVLVMGDTLDRWSFLAFIVGIFFLASAGASAAYLTVSEIFPMETRALAIAFFYAVGTAIGGIAGPLLFGHLIESGDSSRLALGFFIGAGMMALGGFAELAFGVKAEQTSLEDIAEPLTATGSGEEEAEEEEDEHAAQDSDRVREETRRRVERMRERAARRQARDRAGLRRFRPGPPQDWHSPGVGGSTFTPVGSAFAAERVLDREIEAIERALAATGTLRRDELAARVGARWWGPGRFSRALGEAVRDGEVRRVGRSTYASTVPRGD